MIAKAKRAWKILADEGPAGLAAAILRQIASGGLRWQRGAVANAWDHYLDWLTVANAGMLTRGNVDCFAHALRHLPSGAPIVEIGSFCGLSTNTITHLKAVAGVSNKLLTCDKWVFEDATSGTIGPATAIAHSELRAFVKDSFLRNVRMFSSHELPSTIELLSDEFFEKWRRSESVSDVFGRACQLGGPISFAYIDGDHRYEAARRDFEHCDEFLERGGFVLFDDSADGSGWEVCRVVRDVARSPRYELITHNPNYFFRKR